MEGVTSIPEIHTGTALRYNSRDKRKFEDYLKI